MEVDVVIIEITKKSIMELEMSYSSFPIYIYILQKTGQLCAMLDSVFQ